MDVKNILHMNVGETENSYAKNSVTQKIAMSKSMHFLEEAIRELMFSRNFPTTCFNVADLGCASGPNTLVFISNLIDIVRQTCAQTESTKLPQEFQVFLNDLPGNDFNSVFKSLPSFYSEKDKSLGPACFISGVPGSFYGRLFPSKSLHFVHSSYSAHWLSKVPSGLVNKGNIHIVETSPPTVFEAYLKQFQKDFSTFLRLRSKEIISGGRMFITLFGRREMNPATKYGCYVWAMLSESLCELANEGLVKEDDIDSFNLPLYSPHEGEVRGIIDVEGFFTIGKLESFQMNHSDPTDENFSFHEEKIGKYFARHGRALTEPLLASHFRDHVMESLFSKFTKHMSKKLLLEQLKTTCIVISLINK